MTMPIGHEGQQGPKTLLALMLPLHIPLWKKDTPVVN
jgi:hypothetical protein